MTMLDSFYIPTRSKEGQGIKQVGLDIDLFYPNPFQNGLLIYPIQILWRFSGKSRKRQNRRKPVGNMNYGIYAISRKISFC